MRSIPAEPDFREAQSAEKVVWEQLRQDLPDDVGLLAAAVRLDAESLGDLYQLRLVFCFKNRLVECVCGHVDLLLSLSVRGGGWCIGS